MSNEFAIRITAVDNATKVVDKINKSIGRAFQPYDRAKRSALSFFNAVGKNDLVSRSTWGLQVLGGAVGNFSSSFGIAENSVMAGSARMAASLGAIGGPIGGFISGAIAVAGATTAVGVKMAGMGFDVARMAKNLNVTTDHLQEYRGAAKLAGLETEAMDSAMGGLGTTLQDALAGRNLQVATLLNQMGISIKKTKDGAVDSVQGPTRSALRSCRSSSYSAEQGFTRRTFHGRSASQGLPTRSRARALPIAGGAKSPSRNNWPSPARARSGCLRDV